MDTYNDRPPSEQLVDLHVYVIPPELWQERLKSAVNQIITETVSAGFVRANPEMMLSHLRDEIDRQLGFELVPREFAFCKSVGRSLAQVRNKQELHLRVKHFLPPHAYCPEIFVLDSDVVRRSQLSSEGSLSRGSLGLYNDRGRMSVDQAGAGHDHPPNGYHPYQTDRGQNEDELRRYDRYQQPVRRSEPHTPDRLDVEEEKRRKEEASETPRTDVTSDRRDNPPVIVRKASKSGPSDNRRPSDIADRLQTESDSQKQEKKALKTEEVQRPVSAANLLAERNKVSSSNHDAFHKGCADNDDADDYNAQLDRLRRAHQRAKSGRRKEEAVTSTETPHSRPRSGNEERDTGRRSSSHEENNQEDTERLRRKTESPVQEKKALKTEESPRPPATSRLTNETSHSKPRSGNEETGTGRRHSGHKETIKDLTDEIQHLRDEMNGLIRENEKFMEEINDAIKRDDGDDEHKDRSQEKLNDALAQKAAELRRIEADIREKERLREKFKDDERETLKRQEERERKRKGEEVRQTRRGSNRPLYNRSGTFDKSYSELEVKQRELDRLRGEIERRRRDLENMLEDHVRKAREEEEEEAERKRRENIRRREEREQERQRHLHEKKLLDDLKDELRSLEDQLTIKTREDSRSLAERSERKSSSNEIMRLKDEMRRLQMELDELERRNKGKSKKKDSQEIFDDINDEHIEKRREVFHEEKRNQDKDRNLERLQDELKSLENEIARRKQQLDEDDMSNTSTPHTRSPFGFTNEDIQKLKDELNQRRRDLDTLEEELKRKERARKEELAEIERESRMKYEKEIEKLKRELKTLEEELQRKKRDLSEKRESYVELTPRHEDRDTSLHSEIERLRRELSNCQQELNQLEEKSKGHSERSKEEIEVEGQANTSDKRKGDEEVIQKLKEELKTLEDEIERKKRGLEEGQVDDSASHISDGKSSHNSASSSVMRLQDDIKNQKRELSVLEAEHKRRQEEQERERQQREQEKSMDKEERENARRLRKEEQLERLQNELHQLEEKIDTKKSEIDEEDKRFSQIVDDKKERVNSDISEDDEKLVKEREEIERLREEIDRRKREFDDLEEQHKQRMKLWEQEEEEFRRQENEKLEEKEKLRQQRLNEQEETAKRLRDELDELESQMEKRIKDIETTDDKIQKGKEDEENRRTSQDMKTSDDEFDKRRKEIESLTDEINQRRKDLNDIENEHNRKLEQWEAEEEERRSLEEKRREEYDELERQRRQMEEDKLKEQKELLSQLMDELSGKKNEVNEIENNLKEEEARRRKEQEEKERKLNELKEKMKQESIDSGDVEENNRIDRLRHEIEDMDKKQQDLIEQTKREREEAERDFERAKAQYEADRKKWEEERNRHERERSEREKEEERLRAEAERRRLEHEKRSAEEQEKIAKERKRFDDEQRRWDEERRLFEEEERRRREADEAAMKRAQDERQAVPELLIDEATPSPRFKGSSREERDHLRKELQRLRAERAESEKRREDLIKRARQLHLKTVNRRNQVRDIWKKRYFEEKKKTAPLEEQVNKLRAELETCHRKIISSLESNVKERKSSRKGSVLPPSMTANLRIQATRLQHEIEELQRKVDDAKLRLTAEMKLRTQAEAELRAQRAEMTQKKIALSRTRGQQLVSLGTQDVFGSAAPLISPKA